MGEFYGYFLENLQVQGYSGIFSPKSRAKTMEAKNRQVVDGCSIIYRHDRFELVHQVKSFRFLQKSHGGLMLLFVVGSSRIQSTSHQICRWIDRYVEQSNDKRQHRTLRSSPGG